MKRQRTLFELKVVEKRRREADSESETESERERETSASRPGEGISGDGEDVNLPTSLPSAAHSVVDAPLDIARSRNQAPVQPKLRDFPRTTFGSGKNTRDRCFASRWYLQYPFIEYSAERDAVFCFPCRLFPPCCKHVEPVFTESGYTGWKDIGSALNKHESSGAHLDSMAQWAAFRQTQVCGTVSDHLNKERAAGIEANRKYLKSVAKVALLCARQDIALRGHNETDLSENKGNFREILQLVASESPQLQHRLRSAPGNAKYTSKDTQNDVLKAAAEVILEEIAEETRQAEYFAVIADECRDVGRTEQLSVCVRYVSKHDNGIKEQFVGFTDVHKLDASSLAGEIVHQLGKLGVDPKHCVSQCYDGASVMSGHLSGVQAIVRRIVGRGCLYVHCYAHRLNLVVVNTVRSIQDVNDFFGLMEAIYRFFSVSTLRHDKFVMVQRQCNLQVLEIPQLSDTRWVCRYMAVRLYKNRYGCLIDALQDIIDNSKDRSEAAEAIGLQIQLKKFSFLLFLCIFEDILGITKPLSDSLQAKDLNLIVAMELVDSVMEVLASHRTDEYFTATVWNHVMELAKDWEIELSLPCSQRRSKRPPGRFDGMVVLETTGSRSTTSNNPECAYRVIYYQIVDKILAELHARFSEPKGILLSISACNPQSHNFFDVDTIQPLASEYGIMVEKMAPQLAVAKNLLQRRDVHTCEQALHILECMQEAFPEVVRLLRLALTFPITSASAERSFSALKRIKTYLRGTMGQQRLSHLAILSIERGLSGSLDLDKVIDKFDNMQPRRIQLK